MNDPTNWNVGADFIEFKDPQEAKRAEAIMNRLLRESFQNGKNVAFEEAARLCDELDNHDCSCGYAAERIRELHAEAKSLRDRHAAALPEGT